MSWRILVLVALTFSLADTARADESWRKIVDLEGRWLFAIGDNKKWADPAYNDKDWEYIRVPGKWEDQGFNGYNGYAWYRKSFDGTLLKDRQLTYSLVLGYIDDVDEVYFNGHKIGSSGAFPPRYHTAVHARRNYLIPNEFINFAGKNVIAVRVYDAEIEGGIVKGDIGIFTNEDDKAFVVNLRGVWDFSLLHKRSSGSTSDIGNRRPPENTTWTTINVPGVWEHQGHGNYDGTAWYRKQFFVPKSVAGEDLVLILGKIDDYDETYLNGKHVGSMQQYNKLRIYHLSPDMVTPGALNLLLIYVVDHQGVGGISEGPVGIMKQSQFTRFMRWRSQ